MLDPDQIDNEVLGDLMNRLGVDEDEEDEKKIEAAREQIKQMSPREAFNNYLAWNGVHGYTCQFINAIDNLRMAELTPEESDGD